MIKYIRTYTFFSFSLYELSMLSVILVGLYFLSGCSTVLPPVKIEQSLIEKPDSLISSKVFSLDSRPLSFVSKPVLYSLRADNLELVDFLIVLSKHHAFNYDLDNSIRNVLVNLNVDEQPLTEVLRRVASSVHVRVSFEDGSYKFMPDDPYLVLYDISYLNLKRGFTSSTGDSNGTSSSPLVNSSSASSGLSTLNIHTSSTNDFWADLIVGVKSFIHPLGSSYVSKFSSQSHGSDVPVSSVPVSSTILSNASISNIVTSNPDLGLLSVYARASEHELISNYIAHVKSSLHRQVVVELNVMEVSLSDEYQSGVNWSLLSVGGTGLSLSQGLVGQGVSSLTGSMLAVTISNASSLALFKFLQSFGSVNVVSNPKITLSNGNSALLRVVDNYVYFTVQAQTTQSQVLSNTNYSSSAQVVPVGFTMFVNAQIESDGEIVLNLRPSITRLFGYVQDPNPALGSTISQVPQLQTRELDSVLRVASGSTTVLGGLIQEQKTSNFDTVPFMSSLPFIGRLFQDRHDVKQKTELVLVLKATSY